MTPSPARRRTHAATDLCVTREVDWLIAPDSFKGTYSAREVAIAIASGAAGDGAGAVDVCPVADGGEGTMEILVDALGGRTLEERVHDPLGRPITARLGWIEESRSRSSRRRAPPASASWRRPSVTLRLPPHSAPAS